MKNGDAAPVCEYCHERGCIGDCLRRTKRAAKAAPLYSWGVAAFFPEAIAHHADQAVTVAAATIAEAARAGVLKLRQRDGIRGKHFKTVRLTISCMGPATAKETAAEK